MSEPILRRKAHGLCTILGRVCALFILTSALAVWPNSSFAQDNPNSEEDPRAPITLHKDVTLWQISGDLTGSERKSFTAALAEALGDQNGEHLFNDTDFERYLSERQAEVPTCLMGLSTCANPKTMAFDSLSLSLLLRLNVKRNTDGWAANYSVVDGQGEISRQGKLTSQDPNVRELAFALIREVYDATGTITINSEPEGAQVLIDGKVIGVTPLSKRLGVGEHSYRLQLDPYKPIEGSFELRSARTTAVRQELSLRKGTLVIEGAPKGAVVLADGAEIGKVGQPIALPPGDYNIEVRAKGYESFREVMQIEPGGKARRKTTMRRSNPLLRDLSPALIAMNNYFARVSYEHAFQRATFRGASLAQDTQRYEFLRLINPDQPDSTSLDFTDLITPNGVRLDLGFFGEHFGLTVLSLSYLSQELNLTSELQELTTGRVLGASATHVSRLHLRPFQVGFRYLFDRFAPVVEGGIGIDFQWLEIQSVAFEEPKNFSLSEAYWTVALGGQYYFTDKLFGHARYSIQSYFNDGSGLEHQLSIGVGLALPDVFGLDPEPPEQL